MSEETESGASTSETEKLDSTPAPSGGPKVKPWMMIAAVLVAIMLVSTALFFLVQGNKTEPVLTVSISPSPAGVDAGTSIDLTVSVKSGETTLTDKDYKARWSVEPNNLGSFDYFTRSTVKLAASSVQQDGVLKCMVTYKTKTTNATATITIRPPGLDRVSVSPSEVWVRYNTTQIFTAKGISTIGTNLTGLTFDWKAVGLLPDSYNITQINATTLSFTAKAVAGNVTLNATSTYKTATRTGSGIAKVTQYLPTRTVDYRWYDVFKVPFGPWYPQRTLYYPGADYEGVWSDHYPYIYKYFGDSSHQNLYLYSNMRLNITAMNLPEINMTHPEFLPHWGSTSGGHAVLNWHMQYLDPAFVTSNYGPAAQMYNDGWFVNLTGKTTLDKDAAMTVTGMTATEFDDFATYWATKGIALRDKWGTWISEDQANGQFDINNMYMTPFQMIGFGLHAEKVGTKLVLTIYVDAWGMEALMTRWLRDAFVPTEVWMEGFYMNATIGPETSTIYIKTDVEYGVYAFISRVDYKPIWLWKPLHQDYVESSGEHPKSEFDEYAQTMNPLTHQPYTYMNRNPGSWLYNTSVPYDVTPCVWNLSSNETLSFVWPSGGQQFELDIGSPGNVTNLTDVPMAITYAEPMPGDYYSTALKNGSIVLDPTSRTLLYLGPIDFWTWSKNQHAANHQALTKQWIDINQLMLPESAPWVEFGMASSVPPSQIDHFVISDVNDLPVVGDHTNVTVTAYDQLNRVFEGYAGTVHLSSNRSADVTLPSNYQFTSADKGVHTFNTTQFNAAGWFEITASDTLVPSATGSYQNIFAIPTPQQIDHFTIDVLSTKITAEQRVDVSVTAWNQYGRVFHEYVGTVSMTTNATVGNYTLPGEYRFRLAEMGTHKFSGNITWNDSGTYNLTVADTVVTTANATVSGIVVSSSSRITYRIYNMFEDHWMPFWKWRYKGYAQDIILNNTPGNYTMIYNPDKSGYQGIIWAPYRMTINATNITNINVHAPEFMPILDSNTTFANSSATVNVYFQYLYWQWWNSTWKPRWQNETGWFDSMSKQISDGWYLGVQYNVTMNREAAQEWMRLSIATPDDQIAAWWTANATSFKTQWTNWLLYEGNHRLDIYNAYEFPMSVTGPFANLTLLPNGDVRLLMDHVSWGYEVLMNRWLTEKGICTHQPYLENATLKALYSSKKTSMVLDTICQYSMHAVKANESVGTGSAWVFEAIREDYMAPSMNHPTSDYTPYVPLTFMSWNAGDPWYGTEDAYDVTPGWFNLTKSETLTFELPKHDQVIAYLGKGVGPDGINNITYGGYPNGGNYGEYIDMTRHGSMSLGFYITNLAPQSGPGLDLDSMYDAVNKTLTINGPHNFDNSGRGYGNPMYHGAPWIEFNVTYAGSTAVVYSASSPVTVDHGSAVASEPAASTGSIALMLVVYATLASVLMAAVGLRTRVEC